MAFQAQNLLQFGQELKKSVYLHHLFHYSITFMKKINYLFLLLTLSLHTKLVAQDQFFAVDQVQDVKIIFKENNWRYLLDSLRFNGEEMLPCNIVINGEKLPVVAGLRYRDGRSFTPAGRRNSLYISLNFTDSTYRWQGKSALQLSSSLRDPSMIREVIASEISAQYIPSPRANYAKVSINGDAYGFYVNLEVIDDAFFSKHFDGSTTAGYFAQSQAADSAPPGCGSRVYGSLVHENKEPCLSHNFTRLQGTSWDLLTKFTSVLTGDGKQTEQLLAVDQALWYLAINNIIVNLNSYLGAFANPYFLLVDQHQRLSLVQGDLNLAFGSYKNPGLMQSDLAIEDLARLSPLLHADNSQRPLAKQLLSNEYWRKRYLSHYRQLLTDWFTNGKFTRRATELHEFIKPFISEDPNHYYSPEEFLKSLTTTIGQRSNIPGLVAFMEARTAWLKNQSVYTILPPEISKVGEMRRQQFSSQRMEEFRIHAHTDGYARKVTLYYRFDTKEPFIALPMNDDGKHYDEGIGDGIYGAVVKPAVDQSTIQYYIEAENAAAVAFYPARYTYEWVQTNIQAINE